jgi:hypothetical protein
MAVNGFILVADLIRVMINLYCLDDVTALEKKISKVLLKKGLKNKDIIKKEVFISMINEYA